MIIFYILNYFTLHSTIKYFYKVSLKNKVNDKNALILQVEREAACSFSESFFSPLFAHRLFCKHRLS